MWGGGWCCVGGVGGGVPRWVGGPRGRRGSSGSASRCWCRSRRGLVGRGRTRFGRCQSRRTGNDVVDVAVFAGGGAAGDDASDVAGEQGHGWGWPGGGRGPGGGRRRGGPAGWCVAARCRPAGPGCGGGRAKHVGRGRTLPRRAGGLLSGLVVGIAGAGLVVRGGAADGGAQSMVHVPGVPDVGSGSGGGSWSRVAVMMISAGGYGPVHPGWAAGIGPGPPGSAPGASEACVPPHPQRQITGLAKPRPRVRVVRVEPVLVVRVGVQVGVSGSSFVSQSPGLDPGCAPRSARSAPSA